MPREDPYQKVMLDALKKKRRLNSQSLNQRLKELKPTMIDLWNSYRSKTIQIDYSSEKVQEAYLFRYYSLYHRVAYTFLRNNLHTMESLLLKKELRVMFLGAGPAPEILAFISTLYNYYKENQKDTKKIMIHNYDSNKWEYGLNLCSYQHLLWYKKEFKNLGIQLIWFKRQDLNLNNALNAGLKSRTKYDILYSQNLFNEIVEHINCQKFLDNFIKASFNQGAIYFSSDRKNYAKVDDFFSTIGNSAPLSIISEEEDVHTKAIYDTNSLLVSHLFTGEGGLIQSKNAYSTQRIFKIDVR